MALIEIDGEQPGLPNFNMVIFHGELLVITRWYIYYIYLYIYIYYEGLLDDLMDD